MNDASKHFRSPTSSTRRRSHDTELGSGSRLGFYFAVGLGAGAVIALQIDVMRVFSVGSWAHFGSLVVSLAMLGFRLGERGDDRRQGLVRSQLARRRDRFARPVRAARGRRQPLCAASRLQRHLPDLGPGAEVEAVWRFSWRS